jgi:hypothetical protein
MKDNRPEPKKVQIGVTDGKVVEITSGLSEGDKVIMIGSNSQQNNARQGGSSNTRRPPMMPFR